jgi:hypothetical protein
MKINPEFRLQYLKAYEDSQRESRSKFQNNIITVFEAFGTFFSQIFTYIF